MNNLLILQWELIRGGAGDRGIDVWFACNETPELMPMPVMLAHKLAMKLAEVRKQDILTYLRPDGKTQVTVEYRDGMPYQVKSVVVSSQHAPDITLREMREDIVEKVIKPVIPGELLDEENVRYFINPTGRFVIGGPMGDTGLTGRKIIVDTYGGTCRHGGGCFSGKDATKVDRSGSYMARYIAKILLQQDSVIEQKFKLPMSLVFQNLFLFMLIALVQGKLKIQGSNKLLKNIRSHT